jgi:hypothetical protein
MPGRLGLAQRIVIVVALALILGAVGVYVTTLGGPPARFGWFGYAPLTQAIFRPDLSRWEQLLVWIGLIAAWAAVSLVLVRPRHQPTG